MHSTRSLADRYSVVRGGSLNPGFGQILRMTGGVLVALLGLTASVASGQQSCGLNNIQATVDEERQRVTSIGGGFCNNNITGSDQCGGDVGKMEFSLELEGADAVDLTCTSSEGLLCIMANDCQGAPLGERISDTRTRLRGAAPEAILKIVVADDTAQTLCNNSTDITITCAGFFGGTSLFRSGFEGSFEEEGWDTGNCGSCNFFSGTLAAGESVFTHTSGVDLAAGVYRALLEGSPGSEFDLYLWEDTGSFQREIAESAERGSSERLRERLPEGSYRWEIRARKRGGSYTLRLGGPDLGELEP